VRAWIADDGELFGLRTLLREQQIPFSDVSDDAPGHVDLLISNPRRALEVEKRRSPLAPRMHIVLARDLTRTMRQRLQRSSCDFIVEEDAHPGALKLLVEYALYRGPERRVNSRVPVDAEVKLKIGWRQRKATLLQVSERGCGVAVDGPISGDDIVLRLPAQWMQGTRIEVPVRVLEQHQAEGVGQVVSLAFRRMDASGLRALRLAMKRAGQEMGRLDPGRTGDETIPTMTRSVAAKKSPAKGSPAREASSRKQVRVKGPLRRTARPAIAMPALPGAVTRPAEDLPDADRRQSHRAHYMRRVLATRGGQSHVVIGQDISVGGMRIGRENGIRLGDEMKLALYGTGTAERVVLRARVVRDDGQAGLGVQFIDIGPDMRESLGKLIDSIPILGRAVARAKKRPGVIVSEILEREVKKPEK
jgi:hypothetical protein